MNAYRDQADQSEPTTTAPTDARAALPEPLRTRLAEAEARAQARAEKRAQGAAEQAARARIADLEVEELCEGLEAKTNGPIVEIDTPQDEWPDGTAGLWYRIPGTRIVLVVARQGRMPWHRYTTSKMKSADDEALVKKCLIHPSADGFQAALDEHPAFLSKLAVGVAKLYGYKQAIDEKK